MITSISLKHFDIVILLLIFIFLLYLFILLLIFIFSVSIYLYVKYKTCSFERVNGIFLNLLFLKSSLSLRIDVKYYLEKTQNHRKQN